MDQNRFDTVAAVMDAAGGPTEFAKWFGVRRSRASMWKVRGTFPASTYAVMRARLKRDFGIEPPPSVWGQMERIDA